LTIAHEPREVKQTLKGPHWHASLHHPAAVFESAKNLTVQFNCARFAPPTERRRGNQRHIMKPARNFQPNCFVHFDHHDHDKPAAWQDSSTGWTANLVGQSESLPMMMPTTTQFSPSYYYSKYNFPATRRSKAWKHTARLKELATPHTT
jgi:hypothetical protein